MSKAKVQWSDSRDHSAANATVGEAIGKSPHRKVFMSAVEQFAAKANSHETVEVNWWGAPFVYLGVTDDRKHYPCAMRALISFDLDKGTFAGRGDGRYYVFARKGWGAAVDHLAGWSVPRYTECAEPGREGTCPFPVREFAGTSQDDDIKLTRCTACGDDLDDVQWTFDPCPASPDGSGDHSERSAPDA